MKFVTYGTAWLLVLCLVLSATTAKDPPPQELVISGRWELKVDAEVLRSILHPPQKCIRWVVSNGRKICADTEQNVY